MSTPVTVITGTRKGIGRALAERYLGQGHTVIGCSRGAAEWQAPGYSHFTLDVADEAAVQRMFSEVRRTVGNVDHLIANAGTAAMNHSLLTPASTVQKLLATNVLGTFLFCREAAKLMKAARYGRIVTFTTVAVGLKLEGEAAYVASKAAVLSLTQVLARELAEFGITVNAVGPTPIDTDLDSRRTEGEDRPAGRRAGDPSTRHVRRRRQRHRLLSPEGVGLRDRARTSTWVGRNEYASPSRASGPSGSRRSERRVSRGARRTLVFQPGPAARGRRHRGVDCPSRPPEVGTESGALEIRVGSLGRVQALFALASADGRDDLVGVIVYCRLSVGEMVILHIAVSERFASTGTMAESGVALRLFHTVRGVATRLKGCADDRHVHVERAVSVPVGPAPKLSPWGLYVGVDVFLDRFRANPTKRRRVARSQLSICGPSRACTKRASLRVRRPSRPDRS